MSTSIKNALFSLWVPFLLMILGAGSLYIYTKGNTEERIVYKINDFLNQEFEEAQTIPVDQLKLSTTENLVISQLYVLEDDVLEYWSGTDKLTGKDDAFTFMDTIDGRIIKMPIFSEFDSLLNAKVINKTKVPYSLRLRKDNDGKGYALNVGSKTFNCSIANGGGHYSSMSLPVGILMFGYLWLLIVLFNYGGDKLSMRWAILSAVIVRVLFYFVTPGLTTEQMFSVTNTASKINPSVGDFILNIVLLLFVLLIIKKSLHNKKHIKNLPLMVSILNGFFISFSFIYLCFVSKGFILHPNINIDIDAVLLFDISSVSLVTVFIISNIFICLYAIYSLHYIKLNTKSHLPILYHIIGVVASGILFFFFLSFHPLILGAFIIAYLIMVDLFLDSHHKNVVWLIWWMVIHSLFITSLVYYYGLKKDKNSKKEALVSQFHVPDEAEISEFEIFRDDYKNSEIKEIISDLPDMARLDYQDFLDFFNGSLINSIPNKWALNEAIIMDDGHESLFRNKTNDYYNFIQKLSTSELTSPNLYYDYWNSSFLLVDTIQANKYASGPLYLALSLHYNGNQSPNENHLLLFNSDKLLRPVLSSFNDNILQDIVMAQEDFNAQGYSFSVLKLTDDLKVVSFHPLAGLIKPMSLFSYLFTLMGIIIVLFSVINTRFPFLFLPVSLKITQKTSLRNRIQSGVIIMLIFSFIIIGFLTAFYFSNVLRGDSIQRENSELGLIIEKLKGEAYQAGNSETAFSRIIRRIDQMDGVFSHSIGLYDKNGVRLHSDTESSTSNYYMPFTMWEKMSKDWNTIGTYGSEGSDSRVTYIPLYYENEPPFGYLSLSSDKQDDSLKSIYNFLSTLLNVYVFLFLLAGALGIIISNSITMPLSTLANKLRGFKLGQIHDPLEWDSNDEIGTLIKDYNNLIIQVQESADIIAKTERDTAWREMAKQVAHEIKNPLTPMKLSLQYLQKAINSEGVDAKVMIERVSTTLIEQINNLTNIANEFSNFAKMPKSNNEKVILNELVEAVHDLFRKREDMDILLSEPINELYVFADRNQLVRILNNLVKNAIQAIPTDRRGRIEISLYLKDNNAVVRVSDNGIGIPEHMKTKVFTPNFTTKSSGTGLGLAISANIIEGFNGKIYFDTEIDKETNFYVEIPLMRLGSEKEDGKRVSLD